MEVEKASPALAKEFVGEWEGTLEGPGLRLVLKVSNEGTAAKAVLVSLDQDGVEIPCYLGNRTVSITWIMGYGSDSA